MKKDILRGASDFELTADDWKIIDARVEAAKHGAIATDEEVDAVIGRFKELRNEATLGGISWKDLRDKGRK